MRWNAGSTIATELGTLGADANGVTQSEAFSLNGIGAAVGLFGGIRRVLYPGIIFLKISVEYLISFGTFANSQTGNNAPGEKATI